MRPLYRYWEWWLVLGAAVAGLIAAAIVVTRRLQTAACAVTSRQIPASSTGTGI